MTSTFEHRSPPTHSTHRIDLSHSQGLASQSNDSLSYKEFDEYEDKIPDGGAKAYGVLAASTMSLFMSFGMISSFGVFEEYYVHNLLHGKEASSESDVSWIGSTQAFIMLGGGIIFGAMYDRFGARPIMITGSVTYVISTMIISVCKEWYQLFCAQALLLGISISAIFTPANCVLNQWFDKKRGLIFGICSAGASLGGVVWPIALSHLLQRVGFGWTFRIFGFIAAGVFIPMNILMQNRLPPTKGQPMTNIAAFRNYGYTCLTFGQTFGVFGFYFLLFFLPTLAVRLGVSPSMASYSLSVLNAGTFFGRIIPGLLGDYLGRFNILIAALSISGIITLCSLATNTAAGVFVLGGFYGFFSGSIIGIHPACVPAVTTDMRLLGTNLGMSLACMSIPALLSSPISGWLIEFRGGNYDSAAIFAGCMLIIGAIVVFIAKLTLNMNPLARV